MDFTRPGNVLIRNLRDRPLAKNRNELVFENSPDLVRRSETGDVIRQKFFRNGGKYCARRLRLGFALRRPFHLRINAERNVPDRGPRITARVGKRIRQRLPGGVWNLPREPDHAPDRERLPA
jgi:hypothetical protein